MAASQSELTLEDLQRWQESASPLAAQEPGAYFEELLGQFRRAAEDSSTVSLRYFKIGPYRAKFVFACDELAAALSPPFLHLALAPVNTPDLTIGFWDSRISGIPLNPPRWSDLQGSRLSLHGSKTYIQFDFGTEILNALRSQDKMGLFWVKDANRVFFSEKVCPARSIFHWLSADNTFQLIHGGAVGDENGAVILVGKGGSGKSTSCTASLNSDLFFLGDDYCLIDSAPKPRVFSLYASTKVNPDMLPKFPHLAANRIAPCEKEDLKPSFLLHAAFHNRLKTELPLKAILIPRITGQPTSRLLPANSMQGLQALAPSTLFQSTGLGESAFRKMAELSRNLPCFFLEAGTDLQSICREVKSLLRTL